MKKLSLVDKGFRPPRNETPMHVASVALYTRPTVPANGVPAGLQCAQRRHLLPGDRLGRLGLAGNAYWERDDAIWTTTSGKRSLRELFNLVSRLHGTLLERPAPVGVHLIEGLQNRQFAVYTKTHHAAVDGARGVHIAALLSRTPTTYWMNPSLESWTRYKKICVRAKVAHSDQELRNWQMSSNPPSTACNLFRALLFQTWVGRGDLCPTGAYPSTHSTTRFTARAGLSPNLPASMPSQRPSTR